MPTANIPITIELVEVGPQMWDIIVTVSIKEGTTTRRARAGEVECQYSFLGLVVPPPGYISILTDANGQTKVTGVPGKSSLFIDCIHRATGKTVRANITLEDGSYSSTTTVF